MALGWLSWRAWARLVARDAAVLCVAGAALGDIHLRVAGVALGDIHIRFVWQAWRLPRYGTGLALLARLGTFGRLVAGDTAVVCVAGVALGDIHFRFVWQVWHLWHRAGSGVALVHAWARLGTLGRR